jgi:hypothetical protein
MDNKNKKDEIKEVEFKKDDRIFTGMYSFYCICESPHTKPKQKPFKQLRHILLCIRYRIVGFAHKILMVPWDDED